MKIYHDDLPVDIMNRVNKLLKKHGLWFEDNDTEHPDYIEFELRTSSKEFDTSDL